MIHWLVNKLRSRRALGLQISYGINEKDPILLIESYCLDCNTVWGRSVMNTGEARTFIDNLNTSINKAEQL